MKKWSVNGKTWYKSNEKVMLKQGLYNITFTEHDKYLKPKDVEVVIQKGRSINKQENYINLSLMHLTFFASQDDSTVTLTKTGSPNISGLKYRRNVNDEWSDYAIDTEITLTNYGDYVQFMNTETTLSTSNSDYVQFTMTGKISAGGNTQSMLNFNSSCNNYCYYAMFQDCTSLISAPIINATTFSSYSCANMFKGCTNLINVPDLLATTLNNYCCLNMFQNCTSLTKAPALPATQTKTYCYAGMFQGCASLIKTPVLSATTMTPYCYLQMFQSCTSLTQAPSLPATTLANSCYRQMFYNCISLIQATDLSATTLVSGCYQSMFEGCTSLTKTPELPATTLVHSCYRQMFQGCTSLLNISIINATTAASYCYLNMFNGCTSLKSFNQILPGGDLSNYASCFMGMFASCSNLVSISSNMLPATTLGAQSYREMFRGCTSLTQVPELPATTLGNDCYRQMFQGCTSLISFNQTLPGGDLSNYERCYLSMFLSCSNLVSVSSNMLPATTLGTQVYASMFQGCTSLTQTPNLPATNLGINCYQNMFYGCTSLTSIPELPATTLAENCYDQMFQNCYNITSAKINAITLGTSSCRNMFTNDRNLSSVEVDFTDWNIEGTATTNWLNGVAASGTFTKPSSLSEEETGGSYIPTNWTIVNKPSQNRFLSFASPKSNNTSSSSIENNYHDNEKYMALKLFGLNENTSTLQNYSTINSFNLKNQMLIDSEYETIEEFNFTLSNSPTVTSDQNDNIIFIHARWQYVKYNITYYIEASITRTGDYIDTSIQSNIISYDDVRDEQISVNDQNEDYPIIYYLLTIHENSPSMR